MKYNLNSKVQELTIIFIYLIKVQIIKNFKKIKNNLNFLTNKIKKVNKIEVFSAEDITKMITDVL